MVLCVSHPLSLPSKLDLFASREIKLSYPPLLRLEITVSKYLLSVLMECCRDARFATEHDPPAPAPTASAAPNSSQSTGDDSSSSPPSSSPNHSIGSALFHAQEKLCDLCREVLLGYMHAATKLGHTDLYDMPDTSDGATEVSSSSSSSNHYFSCLTCCRQS